MALLGSPHWETISDQMHELISWAGRQNFGSRFYLAGGTALALQLGHRKSADLDFFSENDQVHELTRQQIIAASAKRNGQVIENVDGNLVVLLDDIHIGFFSYGYKMLEPFLELENINLASLQDIGLMKLDAIIGRGSRKDFYDLYAISQKIALENLLLAGERKYPTVRDFSLMAVESIILFDNAERDLQPELIIDVAWDKVQNFFVEKGISLGKRWFR